MHASDGARFLAFDATADQPTGAGIVIYPDVRGLHRFYEELALRFAEHGVDAVAIDYFGRTAATDDRGDSFQFMAHVEKTEFEQIMLDASAAADRLRERGAEHIFVVGFCFGGRLAFASGAREELGLSGVIGFYGSVAGQGRGNTPAPLEAAREGRIKTPVLGLFGGTDEGIPQDSINAFGDALTDSGIESDLVTYPDAPHSFFDRKAADHADAAADAWRHVLSFVRSHTSAD